MINAPLDALLKRAAVWRARSGPARTAAPLERAVPSGWPVLDAILPDGGWPLGTLIELLLPQAGVGELRLLLPALRTLAESRSAEAGRRWLAWIAPPHLPYPPAFAQSGIRPERLLLVTTGSAPERLWATEQALRSGSCVAVLLWLDAVDDRWLRRLKLAAEAGEASRSRPTGRNSTASAPPASAASLRA